MVLGIMGKHSLVIDGKVRDITFRNKLTIPNPVHGASNNYSLYVGDEYWGQVYDMGGSWTAVANKPGELNLMEGFATRRDAGFYITKYMRSGEGCSIHTVERMA
jgi:hypothetical protein